VSSLRSGWGFCKAG